MVLSTYLHTEARPHLKWYSLVSKVRPQSWIVLSKKKVDEGFVHVNLAEPIRVQISLGGYYYYYSLGAEHQDRVST